MEESSRTCPTSHPISVLLCWKVGTSPNESHQPTSDPTRTRSHLCSLSPIYISSSTNSLAIAWRVDFQSSEFPDYYRPRKEPDRVSFADADTAKSGEELLKQFLFDGSSRGNQSSRGRFSTENGETEMKSNRSSHSSISDEYTGDDADLSIKASVNDPSHGIKLTIFQTTKI